MDPTCNSHLDPVIRGASKGEDCLCMVIACLLGLVAPVQCIAAVVAMACLLVSFHVSGEFSRILYFFKDCQVDQDAWL